MYDLLGDVIWIFFRDQGTLLFCWQTIQRKLFSVSQVKPKWWYCNLVLLVIALVIDFHVMGSEFKDIISYGIHGFCLFSFVNIRTIVIPNWSWYKCHRIVDNPFSKGSQRKRNADAGNATRVQDLIYVVLTICHHRFFRWKGCLDDKNSWQSERKGRLSGTQT